MRLNRHGGELPVQARPQSEGEEPAGHQQPDPDPGLTQPQTQQQPVTGLQRREPATSQSEGQNDEHDHQASEEHGRTQVGTAGEQDSAAGPSLVPPNAGAAPGRPPSPVAARRLGAAGSGADHPGCCAGSAPAPLRPPVALVVSGSRSRPGSGSGRGLPAGGRGRATGFPRARAARWAVTARGGPDDGSSGCLPPSGATGGSDPTATSR